MKRAKYFLALMCAWNYFQMIDLTMMLYATSLRCTSSNKTISPDYQCYIKSYSKSLQTYNAWFNITRPLYDFMVIYLRKI